MKKAAILRTGLLPDAIRGDGLGEEGQDSGGAAQILCTGHAGDGGAKTSAEGKGGDSQPHLTV